MNHNRKRSYPWDGQTIEPEIMRYITTLPSSTRVHTRNRLSWIFRKFPQFDFYKFPVTELISSIEGSMFRKQQKEAYFNELKKLFEFLRIDYLFKPNFTEKVQIYENPEDPNKEAIRNYLNSLNTAGTRSRERRKLDYDLKFLYEKFGKKPVLEYDATQIKPLFIDVNQKQIQKSAKERYRIALKNLIHSLTSILRAENKPMPRDYAYLFSDEFFEFSEGSKNHINKHFLLAEELIEFYREVKTNPHHYVMFRIFLSSCRVGGLVHLTVNNINMEERIFQTQEKPTGVSSGWNTYHFPKSLVPELRAYILQKNLQNDDRLFPISEYRVLEILKTYRDWGCHDFRRSMLKLWRTAKMDIIDRSFLSNHDVPKEAKTDSVYTGDNSVKYLRDIYDEYFFKIFKGRL